MSTKKNIKEIMSKRYIQIGILIVLISLVGLMGTYAWFTWKSSSNTNVTLSIGNLADVTFTSGSDINISNLAPVYNYTDGVSTTFVMKNNSTTNNLNYEIKLDVTSISNELKNESFKYTLLKDNKVVQTGNLKNAVNGKTLILNTGLLAKGSTSNYKLYFWIDGNIENSSSMMNKSLVGKITVEEKPTLSKKITDLYTNAPKAITSVNGVTYNLASSVGLMNDRKGSMSTDIDAGNIRYYGASPNNYIYFNCDSYPSTNCELWRIIGVFDGKIKLMRNSTIGSYSWDTSASSVNDGYGVNEWSQADLMKLLNPGHESESVGGSLYYNSKSGTCYNGSNNATKSCNFTSTGIKNDTTRNMIADTTYNTGGCTTSNVFSNVMYEKERGTAVISNPSDGITRTTTWTGKIALAYPSDYGYATDLSKCSQRLYYYNNSTCKSNDWMYSIFEINSYNWLLTPLSNLADYASDVNSSSSVGNSNTYNANVVAPVLYLDSDQDIVSGDGSQSNPYQLANS